jgi:hypothetical protein
MKEAQAGAFSRYIPAYGADHAHPRWPRHENDTHSRSQVNNPIKRRKGTTMNPAYKQNFIAAALVGVLAMGGLATQTLAQEFSSEQLNRRTLERRAVDAVIWGLPLVGEDAVKQAYFRDGKAKYNDIVWWPKGGGWKNQSPTPNVNTRYMYFFCNTKQDGPVVVELPPAVPGASFYGTHRRCVVCAARRHWLRGQGW